MGISEAAAAAEPSARPQVVAKSTVAKPSTSVVNCLQDLFEEMDGWRRKPNIPVKNAGDIFNRYLDVTMAVKHLEDLGWTKSKGGFKFPSGAISLPSAAITNLN